MNVTLIVNEEGKKKLGDFYKDHIVSLDVPYGIFRAKVNNVSITLYESGKVLFQGPEEEVEEEVSLWKTILSGKSNDYKVKETKTDDKINIDDLYEMEAIGSDEVGNGSYLGPIVVTAFYLNKDNISKVKGLGIGDSKKLGDNLILELAPLIMDEKDYEYEVLSNEEYNKLIYSGENNIKAIMAKMHTKCHILLEAKINKKVIHIIDEFAKEDLFYKYLEFYPHDKNNKYIFIPKGEDKSLAVAAASVISRFIYLKEMEKLEKELGTKIPKGAGLDAQKFGEDLKLKYGNDILQKYAKTNFDYNKKNK